MNKFYFFVITLLFGCFTFGQNSLLNEISAESDYENTFQMPAFKAMKVVNNQSTKLAGKGDLYLYVGHRFGAIKGGIGSLFGLDYANTKIEMLYGLFSEVQVGFSRESFKKTYNLHVKYGIKKQTSSFPVSIVGYNSINLDTSLDENVYPNLNYNERYVYISQLLVSRRFSDNFSLQLSPSVIKHNFLTTQAKTDYNYVLNTGSRLKISKRSSFNIDYSYHLNRLKNSIEKNVLSVGVDMETGGHVFQLLFSNTQASDEAGVLTGAEGDWLKGDVFFGFNILRVF
ncbi:DUF5777 family beta-barrel protein [Flavobacteriaceae bacterium]|jgi:hypothetical protein|nr:DUF5777 family beta-barrel protein [Flavobacteriaceae bacterium]MDA8904330.1 DUF5777 family beta-barrel protein [Flavobacteriaceae bacterium]MDA9284983.1 DUF5777 family beta-barrel protein [Flavobacteriaceae bacterium]MDA9573257.1 DUF5777 family beta-barrel protein [Flavobacteriaceae bacterium]MDB4212813.1 DUF5777 family beta-barrel protein [Flavobacteriaceae bacterium]